MSVNLEEQYDKIYRYCYFKVRRRETAEDITQETFLRFLEQNRFADIERRLPYLYTIARNLCIDEYRRRTTEELTEDYADNSEEETVERIAVQKALSVLDAQERELLLLRYVNDMRISDMAKFFGISRFAMSRRINAAVKKFRHALEKEGIYE